MNYTTTYEFFSTKTKEEEEDKVESKRKSSFKLARIRRPTKEMNLSLKMKQPNSGLQYPRQKTLPEKKDFLRLRLEQRNFQMNAVQVNLDLQLGQPNLESNALQLDNPMQRRKPVQQSERPTSERDFLELQLGLPNVEMSGGISEHINLLGKLKRPNLETDGEKLHYPEKRRKLLEGSERLTQEKDFLKLLEESERLTQEKDFLKLRQGQANIERNGIEDADFLSLRLGRPNLEINGLQVEESQQREEQQILPLLQIQQPQGPWQIVKTLTMSDTNHLCRLVLRHCHLDTFFPMWDADLVRRIREGEPIDIVIRDVDTAYSMHRMVFRRWRTNNLFIIQSHWRREFVVRRELKVGDEIGMSWSPEHSCFFFSVLRRA